MCIRDRDGTVIDSVKHVDGTVSSVREILPGGVYAPPPPQNKVPLTEFGADDTIPVSYTHLDVYKRQALLRLGGLLYKPSEQNS